VAAIGKPEILLEEGFRSDFQNVSWKHGEAFWFAK
jgi:hypothetical protein